MGRATGRPANLEAIAEVARAVATPLQVAGGIDGPEQIELAFAAGATRVVMPLWAVVEDPDGWPRASRIAGDWLGGRPRRAPERLREYPWNAIAVRPRLSELVDGARRCGGPPVRRCRTAARRPDLGLDPGARRERRRRGRGRRRRRPASHADRCSSEAGAEAVILGEALFDGRLALRAMAVAAAAPMLLVTARFVYEILTMRCTPDRLEFEGSCGYYLASAASAA